MFTWFCIDIWQDGARLHLWLWIMKQFLNMNREKLDPASIYLTGPWEMWQQFLKYNFKTHHTEQ